MSADIFDFGRNLVRAQSKFVNETARLALDASYRPHSVYLIWNDQAVSGPLLLVICETKASAEREALTFAHACGVVARIEAREVHR